MRAKRPKSTLDHIDLKTQRSQVFEENVEVGLLFSSGAELCIVGNGGEGSNKHGKIYTFTKMVKAINYFLQKFRSKQRSAIKYKEIPNNAHPPI